MTSSPDLIHELRASRPTAPVTLRARVRELSSLQTAPSPWPTLRLRLPARRMALIAVPAAMAVAFASAGVLGLARSDGDLTAVTRSPDSPELTETTPQTWELEPLMDTHTGKVVPIPAPNTNLGATGSGSARGDLAPGAVPAGDSAIAPDLDRASRVSATLAVEVADSDAVSRAAQDALDLTRRLGGHVVSASVATGEEGSATLTVRVPVGKVQEAIVGLSSLGRIVSQQVAIEDLQESLDALERRARSVRAQIALVSARLDSESLDAETRAVLENRRKSLRSELRGLRRSISGTNAEARMSTIQLTVVTPGAFGAVAPPARLDRTIDEALNVLVWEAVIALAILIVAAPFALAAFAAWLGRRVYRRREEDRLLATS